MIRYTLQIIEILLAAARHMNQHCVWKIIERKKCSILGTNHEEITWSHEIEEQYNQENSGIICINNKSAGS